MTAEAIPRAHKEKRQGFLVEETIDHKTEQAGFSGKTGPMQPGYFLIRKKGGFYRNLDFL